MKPDEDIKPKSKEEKAAAKAAYIKQRNQTRRQYCEEERLKLNPHQLHRCHRLACEIYDYFNNILTGNKLKPSDEGLFWSNRLMNQKKSFCGFTIGDGNIGYVDSIILADDYEEFEKNPNQLYGTLFHEYVHAYINVNYLRDNSSHGYVWQNKAKQLWKTVRRNRDMIPANLRLLELKEECVYSFRKL